MISLSQIEQDLVLALKAKDQVLANTLRGLKTRLVNEKISKARELSEEEILAVLRSEVKKRTEAAEGFTKGGNTEAASKELREAEILEKFLPAQMPEEEVEKFANEIIAANNFVAADFGKAMGVLKAKVGNAASGAILAKVLKEKLK